MNTFDTHFKQHFSKTYYLGNIFNTKTLKDVLGGDNI